MKYTAAALGSLLMAAGLCLVRAGGLQGGNACGTLHLHRRGLWPVRARHGERGL